MHQNILLDIDAVLDTRLGRLRSIDPKIDTEVLFKFNEYCSRDHDNMWLLFPEIKEEVYSKLEVTTDILKLSPRTNVFNVIDDAMRSTEGSEKDEVNLTIHFLTRAYELSEASLEAFMVMISARYDHKFKVKLVTTSLKELTPLWLKENVDLVILYNFNDWCELHHEELAKESISRLVFYIPTLFIDKVDAERNFFVKLKGSKLEGNPLELISDYIWESYRINLYFISNKFFAPIALNVT